MKYFEEAKKIGVKTPLLINGIWREAEIKKEGQNPFRPGFPEDYFYPDYQAFPVKRGSNWFKIWI